MVGYWFAAIEEKKARERMNAKYDLLSGELEIDGKPEREWRTDMIEFKRYAVSGHLECVCGQHHVFIGVSNDRDEHTCEVCGRVYQLMAPTVILVDGRGTPESCDPEEDR